jgi:hypothetical protein
LFPFNSIWPQPMGWHKPHWPHSGLASLSQCSLEVLTGIPQVSFTNLSSQASQQSRLNLCIVIRSFDFLFVNFGKLIWQRISPFSLSCQIDWNNFVYNITL